MEYYSVPLPKPAGSVIICPSNQESEKPMPRILSTYTAPEGFLVTVYAARAPRKGERTFPAIKGSISNMGAKAVKLACVGINKRARG
jgi:hypothetical protein